MKSGSKRFVACAFTFPKSTSCQVLYLLCTPFQKVILNLYRIIIIQNISIFIGRLDFTNHWGNSEVTYLVVQITPTFTSCNITVINTLIHHGPFCKLSTLTWHMFIHPITFTSFFYLLFLAATIRPDWRSISLVLLASSIPPPTGLQIQKVTNIYELQIRTGYIQRRTTTSGQMLCNRIIISYCVDDN